VFSDDVADSTGDPTVLLSEKVFRLKADTRVDGEELVRMTQDARQQVGLSFLVR